MSRGQPHITSGPTLEFLYDFYSAPVIQGLLIVARVFIAADRFDLTLEGLMIIAHLMIKTAAARILARSGIMTFPHIKASLLS